MLLQLLQSVSSAFLQIDATIEPFHCSGNSSSFQTELISLRIAERIVLSPAKVNSAGIWSVPGDFVCVCVCVLKLVNSHLKHKGTGLRHCCMYFCLPNVRKLSWSACYSVTPPYVPALDKHTDSFVSVSRCTYVRICRPFVNFKQMHTFVQFLAGRTHIFGRPY
jgi:hypothetical protein